jgi:hypothetical protein
LGIGIYAHFQTVNVLAIREFQGGLEQGQNNLVFEGKTHEPSPTLGKNGVALYYCGTSHESPGAAWFFGGER